MPTIFKQIFNSEKFWYVALLFMAPITMFTAMGLMTIVDWRHDALWALSLLIGGKTLQGVADRMGPPRGSSGTSEQTATSAVTVNVPAPAAAPAEPPPPAAARATVQPQHTRPMTSAEYRELGVKPDVPPPLPPVLPEDDS